MLLSSSGLLNPMKRDLLLRLQSEIENVTDAWLSTALKSLLLIQSRLEYSTDFVYLPKLVCALKRFVPLSLSPYLCVYLWPTGGSV